MLFEVDRESAPQASNQGQHEHRQVVRVSSRCNLMRFGPPGMARKDQSTSRHHSIPEVPWALNSHDRDEYGAGRWVLPASIGVKSTHWTSAMMCRPP